MWTYESSTGHFSRADGPVFTTGYSGHGEGKNNPDFERVHAVGPIPRGMYHIGPLFDSDEHGPHCLRLTPINGTDTFGRDGFLAHGDSIAHPGEASLGCIILMRWVRDLIAASGDCVLQVV